MNCRVRNAIVGNRSHLWVGVLTALGAFAINEKLALGQSTLDRLCPKSEDLLGREHESLIRGTVGRDTTIAAISRNAQIYGVANMMGQRVLPLLEESKSGVFFYSLTSTFGALRAPRCKNDTNQYGPMYKLNMAKIDLGSFVMGGGLRYGYFSAFYGVSASIHTIGDDAGNRVWGASFMPFAASVVAPFVAPFKQQFIRDDFSMSLDYTVGGQVHTPVGAIAAGYVGSQGVFTNFNERHIQGFAGVVLNDFQNGLNLPYLVGGIRSFHWLTGKSVTDLIGQTSVYGRKLQFVGAPPAGADLESLTGQKILAEDFITAHLEQRGLLRHWELIGAYAIRPKPQIYEVSVGYHPFGVIPYSEDGQKLKQGEGFFRIVAGVVKLPDLWFYGVQGGYRARVAVQAEVKAAGLMFKGGIGMNDPEILAAFPYAYNAVQVTLGIGTFQ